MYVHKLQDYSTWLICTRESHFINPEMHRIKEQLKIQKSQHFTKNTHQAFFQLKISGLTDRNFRNHWKLAISNASSLSCQPLLVELIVKCDSLIIDCQMWLLNIWVSNVIPIIFDVKCNSNVKCGSNNIWLSNVTPISIVIIPNLPTLIFGVWYIQLLNLSNGM